MIDYLLLPIRLIWFFLTVPKSQQAIVKPNTRYWISGCSAVLWYERPEIRQHLTSWMHIIQAQATVQVLRNYGDSDIRLIHIAGLSRSKIYYIHKRNLENQI